MAVGSEDAPSKAKLVWGPSSMSWTARIVRYNRLNRLSRYMLELKQFTAIKSMLHLGVHSVTLEAVVDSRGKSQQIVLQDVYPKTDVGRAICLRCRSLSTVWNSVL